MLSYILLLEKPHKVGIVIRRTNFNRRWQIEYDTLVSGTSLSPSGFDRLTYSDREVGLGLGESFGTVFVLKYRPVLGRSFLCQLSDDLGVLNSEVNSLVLGVPEDNFSETGTRGIVHVKDSTLGTRKGINCASDQVLPSRSKDLCSTRLQHTLE